MGDRGYIYCCTEIPFGEPSDVFIQFIFGSDRYIIDDGT